MLQTKFHLILLNLFWVFFFSINGQPICQNAEIQCLGQQTTLACDIFGLDTEVIQETLFSCADNSSFEDVTVAIQAGGEGVTLNITLPDNIIGLEITNNYPSPVEVLTSTVHWNLIQIDFRINEISLGSNDFFSYFPPLKNFSADALGSEGFPIFSNNSDLLQIVVHSSVIRNTSSLVITRVVIGGLSSLEVFCWYNGGVTGIASDAFFGLTSLRQILLSGNNISQLLDCTFSDLASLYYLELVDNNVTTVGEYTFIGLDALKIVVLNNNPSFPLDTLTLAKNISGFGLDFYDPSLLNVQFFQQFPYLQFISFENIPFDCSCEYEWISKLSDFNINLYLDSLTFCPSMPGIQVNNSVLYTNCNNEVTYQCFNHSIVCEGDNWLRVDSGNSCLCTFPPERRFYNETSLVCSDIDECETDTIICQGNCTNTFGSYTCSCDDGYVNINATTCDLNECVTANGGCSQNCTNTVGSYLCSCFEGYNISLSNSSDCDLIEATVSPRRFLNLTETEFSILVIAMALTAILLIVLVTIGLITAILYFGKGSLTPKPSSKPTLAQLDKMKAEKNLVIENPMPLYGVVPAKTNEFALEPLAPKEGTEIFTSEPAVTSTDA